MFGFLTGAALIVVGALFTRSASGPAVCSMSTVGAGRGEEEGLLVAISSTAFGGGDEKERFPVSAFDGGGCCCYVVLLVYHSSARTFHCL